MINELILTAEILCANLDKAAQSERQFNIDICMEFERWSWEILRMTDNIKLIKEECGV